MQSQEFYFVRHGQTDHNISTANLKGEHPEEIPLNETGRLQAFTIAPYIATLPIQTVCASPLKRVQETKNIITSELKIEHHPLDSLRECSTLTWKEMAKRGMYAPLPEEGIVRSFMDRIKIGIEYALSLPGPQLIVAHGGVHWALCCLLEIQEHPWGIDNCVPVHFILNKEGKWTAKKLL